MPNVDVVDLNNQKVGEIELSDTVFAAPVKKALLYEAVRHHLAGTAPGHGQDQGPSGSIRLGQEAVAAERHRPGPCGVHPLSAVEARRHGSRSGPPRLQLQAAEER